MGTNINLNKKLGISKGCSIILPSGPSLLLDLYPNATVAYSVRRLSSTYTGNLIRVRRSSDNTEQNIGYNATNDLDTTALLDFVGYNLWTYSQDLSQSVWSKGNLNTTGTPPYLDVTLAPDGTLTGDKLIENTNTSSHAVVRTGVASTGIDYNISIYLKQAERTKVRISSAIGGLAKSCELDLTNGSISNNTFINTPVVTSEANGWYRFSVTITSGGSSGTNGMTINLMSGSSTVYAGDGISGCFIWGGQLSQTSSVKTYQTTTTDTARNGFVTTWYDQSGNANNGTQTTALNQPQIVSAGSLLTKNSKPSMVLSTNNTGFTLGSTISVGTSSYNSLVGNKDAAGTMLRALTSTATDGYKLMNNYDNKYYIYAKTGSYLVSNSADTTTSQILLTGMNVSGTMSIYKNGSAVATTLNSWNYTNSIGSIGFGASGANYRFQEAIFYNSDKSSSRTGIESNINTYYTIF